MGIRKSGLVWLTLLACVSVAGCSSSSEEAPLVEGLEFQYEWGFDGDAVLFNISVQEDGDEHFLLDIETEDDEGEARGKAIRVDRFFKARDGKLAALVEIPLWLPPSMREPGSEIVPDGSISMRTKGRTWYGWNVLVAGGGAMLGTAEWYYEKETGFLVGSHVESMGSTMSIKLVDTNVPGLQVSN